MSERRLMLKLLLIKAKELARTGKVVPAFLILRQDVIWGAALVTFPGRTAADRYTLAVYPSLIPWKRQAVNRKRFWIV